jgi:hypothetical protein
MFTSVEHGATDMTASRTPHPCVVVGFDGSPASHVALSRAIQIVGRHGKLFLVHAWDAPEAWRGRGTYQPYVNRELAAAEAVLGDAVTAHPGLADVEWESELVGGPPSKMVEPPLTERETEAAASNPTFAARL